MNTKQLEEAIESEWRAMHHNASISRYWPDMRNEYESDLFDACLGDYGSQVIEELEEMAKQRGFETKFYACGRSGATFYPDKYMRSVGGSNFGPCNYTIDDGLDGLNHARRFLAFLKEINKICKESAKYTPEWWRDMKEANDYQKDINEHDGMKPHQVTVWR